MVACSQTAATGATVNPRTGEPYKRAPYKKASAELKAAAAQQRTEVKEAKTAAAACPSYAFHEIHLEIVHGYSFC